MKKLITICLLSTILSCQKKEVVALHQFVKDEHSFSKPNDAIAKHLDLDIKVDFESQSISGKATWTIDNTSKGNEIIFDENTLNITKVTLGDGVTVSVLVEFQNGPIKEVGVNGVTNEALLAIVIDRLQGFQKGQFQCRENAIALTHLEDAMHWLQHRTNERLKRGVEGTHQK